MEFSHLSFLQIFEQIIFDTLCHIVCRSEWNVKISEVKTNNLSYFMILFSIFRFLFKGNKIWSLLGWWTIQKFHCDCLLKVIKPNFKQNYLFLCADSNIYCLFRQIHYAILSTRNSFSNLEYSIFKWDFLNHFSCFQIYQK